MRVLPIGVAAARAGKTAFADPGSRGSDYIFGAPGCPPAFAAFSRSSCSSRSFSSLVSRFSGGLAAWATGMGIGLGGGGGATATLGGSARRAFEIGSEDPRRRDRYGRNFFGQRCLHVMAGAGIPGGAVLGKTDEEGGAPTANEYFTCVVAATIYAKLGIPLDLVHTTPDGPRPIKVNEGKVIREWM